MHFLIEAHHLQQAPGGVGNLRAGMMGQVLQRLSHPGGYRQEGVWRQGGVRAYHCAHPGEESFGNLDEKRDL